MPPHTSQRKLKTTQFFYTLQVKLAVDKKKCVPKLLPHIRSPPQRKLQHLRGNYIPCSNMGCRGASYWGKVLFLHVSSYLFHYWRLFQQSWKQGQAEAERGKNKGPVKQTISSSIFLFWLLSFHCPRSLQKNLWRCSNVIHKRRLSKLMWSSHWQPRPGVETERKENREKYCQKQTWIVKGFKNVTTDGQRGRP